MRKILLITMLMLASTFIFAQAQEIPFYKVSTSLTAFGKTIKVNDFIYLADSNAIYKITTQDYDRYKTMRNVFSDGYYVKVADGASGYFRSIGDTMPNTPYLSINTNFILKEISDTFCIIDGIAGDTTRLVPSR